MASRATAGVAALLVLALAGASAAGDGIDKRAVQKLGMDFFQARPPTRFGAWDPARRAALLERARALGPIPEGSLDEVRDLLWKGVHKVALKGRKHEMETPYGQATWLETGRGGPRSGLLIGLHGGGAGAGDAHEAQGNWSMPGVLAIYPQGIRLVDDTWNTVHGEAFVVSLIEYAKARHEIDPDRVYVAGFSMGGSGSWHMAGRQPDLFAAAIPAHGVLMAAPKSQVQTPQEVQSLQYGLLPNVRNLALWFYTGSADDHCMPGTFLYAWDRIQEMRKADPGGYADIHFEEYEGLKHAFPPGEPHDGLAWAREKRRNAFPEKLVWEYAANPWPLPDEQDKVARIPKRWFYWLECDRPADTMQVTATRHGNTFDLDASIALPEDFTIYLNPAMIDVEKEVVVNVGGKEVYRGRPEPTVACVLESLDAKLDRTLVFDRKVKIPAP